MATEVFNRIGEGESYSENNYFHKKEENDFIETDKIESTSKPLSKTKKEFFKHLEEDSLTIDTCNKLNNN